LAKEVLNRTSLYAITNDNYCVIIFPKDTMAIFDPLGEESQTYITSFDDDLLGTGTYESHCYLMLKKRGVSAIRILPKWRFFVVSKYLMILGIMIYCFGGRSIRASTQLNKRRRKTKARCYGKRLRRFVAKI